MGNKNTLSLKLNKSFLLPLDAPFTPVEQTLQTPVDLPNQMSYFAMPSLSVQGESFFSQNHDNDSDDVMTDVDEPLLLLPKTIRNYSVSFTASFDQILMNIYSHVLLLPTTTPFLGYIPPLGLADRVANDTFLKMVADSDPSTTLEDVVYDTQGMLNHEQLRNPATNHIVLHLIRKRLLDLCGAQRVSKQKNGPPLVGSLTSILVAVPLNSGAQSNSVYNGLGLRQLSISTLLLNEHNSTLLQQSLAGSRLRSSSLNLRKHSLTRNNSATGASWLHVGNLLNIRPGAYANQEYSGSTDSLQLMNDFVPHQFLTRLGSTLSNPGQNAISTSGFNPMMMDYQTPPSSSKSSISYGSGTPSASGREEPSFTLPGSEGSYSDNETSAPVFLGARSLSRGSTCSFPKPLTINTDLAQLNFSNTPGFGGDALHSPFVSAVAAPEDFEYFGRGNVSAGSVLENVLLNVGHARGTPSNADSSVKDTNESRPSLSLQFSLSEKKRDSLKLKRGIH